jgi:inorganic triphosphatase YgiF
MNAVKASINSTAAEAAVDDDTFDVLNAIYLHKMASVRHIADVVEQDAASVEGILKREAAEGAVLDLEGSWLLQELGTAKVLAFYRTHYATLRSESEIIAWYEKFETSLNQQFIKAVSDWQTSDGDSRAQEKMAKLVERMVRSLGQIADKVPRYRLYAERFVRAMEKADRGERDFVCKPTVDSMHNIWFEFHEDILAVVGRPRDV